MLLSPHGGISSRVPKSDADADDDDLFIDQINFSEIDEDLAAFQEDEMVQQALHRGVDLSKYGKELEKDLRVVSYQQQMQYNYLLLLF